MNKIKIDSNNIHYYYDKVNSLIDDYFKWNIKASKLKKYFDDKNKMKNFIQSNNLDNVDQIKKIIDDVISDRVNLERDLGKSSDKKDDVKTFESFSFLDDISKSDIRICLYKPNYIEVTNSHLNILSDYFEVSIDHIKKEKSSIIVYELNKQVECFIYSKDDIESIKNNIVSYIVENLKGEEIVVGNSNINVTLKDLISDNTSEIIKKKLNDDIVKKIINIIHKGFKMSEYDKWTIFQKESI